ncbi:MFS transporter [Paenibacillus zeisoli]|uniref:MFS transporter n=1 Tax=Paenibacillus zeisoli TaxID=2496267 RepID=A0A433X6I0_9BACL|nr:MFS transporter [Paenibacillus zeisoli]RUT29631.1 MFS transporter [Paenibacillus zeisoli]
MKAVSTLQEARMTAILFLLIFTVGCDTFLVSPLLPKLAAAYHMEEAQGGQFVLAYAGCYAVSAIILGPMSDRIGRSRILLGGASLFTVFTVLCGLSQSYRMMLLFRALSGVAAAAISPQVWALIGDHFPYERRGRVLGIVTSALSLSQILGVPLAAWSASVWGWRSAFFMLAGLSLMGSLTFMNGFARNRTSPPKVPQGSLPAAIALGLSRAIRNKQALTGLGVMFFMSLGSLGMYTFIGVFLWKYMNMSLVGMGWAIAAIGGGNLAGNLAGGYASDRWGERSVALFFMLLMAGSLLSLPYLSAHSLLVMLAIVVWQFSGGASLVAFNSLLSELEPQVRGTVMSLNNAAMYAGTTVGVALNGWILEHFDFMGVGWICGSAIAAAVVGMLRLSAPAHRRQIKIANE